MLGMFPSQMPMNLIHMMGTRMTRNTMGAYVMGTVMHFGAGIIYAIAHTALYLAFGLESQLLLWGILFGVVHYLVAGMGMGMMGVMHPRIRAGEMAAPGPFVRNLPMVAVVGFPMVHVVFGLVVGVMYEALA